VFPNNPNAKALFEGNPALASATATRNGTLSGAYFMLVARALGLDCGPMSGFDIAKVDAEFFPDGRYATNFIINLGYADNTKLFKRSGCMAAHSMAMRPPMELPTKLTLDKPMASMKSNTKRAWDSMS